VTDRPVRFLDDVRVLEVANMAPNQLAMHLADLGADVIKIEPPSRGDATRLIARRPGFADSGLHRRWNRGKKNIALDMTKPEGVEVFLRLVPHVDVVIEGLRPGTLEKMGVSWKALTELNPRLVMIALSGYGQDGPYRDLPSHGIGFDAVAGLSNVEEDELGRPRVVADHINIGTLVAPLLGATAVLAALSWSRRTGKPVFLDLAQADAAAFARLELEWEAAQRSAETTGVVDAPPPPPRPAGPHRSTMQAYRTRDGQVLLLMTLERKFFARLAEAVDRPDLLDHVPENQYLVQGSQAIDDALVEIIASRDLADWMQVFAAADVPAVPVNEGAGVLDDPQLRSRLEWLPADQGTVTMKTPVKSEPPIPDPSPASALGQDTLDVLELIGMDTAEIDRLTREGVLLVTAGHDD
jgi:crotonobetainyl-CoA:carnitine CoA-transferase CaiB-like acyl-CoA transferase